MPQTSSPHIVKPAFHVKYKIAINIFIFFLIFILLDNFLGFGLDYFSYAREYDMHSLVWKDLYNQDRDSVDVMFVGSSHTRFAFDTRQFDKELGIKTFNLSSSDQTPVIGYFALKEALKYQKPKVLVYDAYWRKFGSKDNTTPAYFNYEYIRGLDVKLGIIASLWGDKGFAPFLEQASLKTYRHREKLIPIFKNLLHGKIYTNKNYGLKTIDQPIDYDLFTYYKNGYFGSTQVVNNDKLYKNNPFKTAPQTKWNKKQLEYFKKTLELCKSNNIKVIVVTVPIPAPTMKLVKNYKGYNKVIADISRDYKLEYLDYNLKENGSDSFRNEYFMDSNHLNTNGAQVMGTLLVPVLKRYLEE